MTKPLKPSPLDPHEDHVLEWNDRLQDLLDGDLGDAERVLVESHLADCSICPELIEAFRSLDGALSVAAPSMSLGAAFDARLLREIDAIDDQQRVRQRQRLEQERHDQLQSLSQRWKRSLAFVVPGVVAAMALIFALIGSVDHSEISRNLSVEGLGEFGRHSALYVHAALIAIIGAGIGLPVARWLSSAAD